MTPLRRNLGYWLAIAPFIGWTLAFSFELGYLSRYRLPASLIQLDVTHVLATIFAVGLVVVWVRNLLGVIPQRPWRVLVYLLSGPTVTLVFAGISFYSAYSVRRSATAAALILGVLGLVCLAAALAWFLSGIVYPLIKYKDLPSRWDRLARRSKELSSTDFPTVADSIWESGSKAFGARFPLVVAVALLAPVASNALGRWYAWQQHSFHVSNDSPPCIALRRYGASLICVEVDTVAWATTGAFRIVAPGSGSPTFRPYWIPRLRVDTAAPAHSGAQAWLERFYPMLALEGQHHREVLGRAIGSAPPVSRVRNCMWSVLQVDSIYTPGDASLRRSIRVRRLSLAGLDVGGTTVRSVNLQPTAYFVQFRAMGSEAFDSLEMIGADGAIAASRLDDAYSPQRITFTLLSEADAQRLVSAVHRAGRDCGATGME